VSIFNCSNSVASSFVKDDDDEDDGKDDDKDDDVDALIVLTNPEYVFFSTDGELQTVI
jgi:hypothetical protein